MDFVQEVMVISDDSSTGTKHNFSIYDVKTGSLIFTYKEASCVPKGLAMIGGEYFLSACKERPEVIAWTATKRQFEKCKMIIPGIVTSLAVNDVGDYCVAGIDKSMLLWEISSGKLLKNFTFHSQPITCLKFSSDGTYIISGGKDGLTLVWLFSSLVDVSSSSDTRNRPHHVWLDHSSEITDIHVGKLGMYARVATASRDKSCIIYELESGQAVCNICTFFEITSVAMDNTENFLMLGSTDGKIHRVNMFPNRDGEVITVDAESKLVFEGHKLAVTSLSVSTFGKYLLSGSTDGSAILWNIINFGCLNKFTFEGAVTNAFITLLPPGLKSEEYYIPKHPVGVFRRDPCPTPDLYFVSRVADKNLALMDAGNPDDDFDASILLRDKRDGLTAHRASDVEMNAVNMQIYSYALCDLVRSLPSFETE